MERFFFGHHHLRDPMWLGIRGVVLVERTGPAQHRNDRRFLLPFDLAGVGPPHAPAANYRRLRSIVIFHDTHIGLGSLLEMSRLQVEAFLHCLMQLTRPGIAFYPFPGFRPPDGLDRPDPGLPAFAAFYEGLKYV